MCGVKKGEKAPADFSALNKSIAVKDYSGEEKPFQGKQDGDEDARMYLLAMIHATRLYLGID
jgi:hypothetical protein